MPAATKVDVMESYCKNCRRSYEDVGDKPCPAAEGNEYLRGGPIGVRAKRTGNTAAAAASIVQPVIRPRPTLRPVPRPQLQPQAQAPAPQPKPRPARRRRPNPVPAWQGVALMLPFEDLDAPLTG